MESEGLRKLDSKYENMSQFTPQKARAGILWIVLIPIS